MSTTQDPMIDKVQRELPPLAENLRLAEMKISLLAQIRSSDDFPVTTAAVSLIGQLTSEREVPIAELANAVLGDYGLTSKLLKLINSVYYLRFGEVTTVSRAIILLGTDHLRDIALSVTLFERLQTKASQAMIDVLSRAVYAAVIARKMARETGYSSPEEAFICSLFHTLGEMLTVYYAPKLHAVLSGNSASDDESTAIRASLLYLGVGKEIAQGWRFPARIVQSMERPGVEIGHHDEVYRLCCISSGANEVARISEEDLDPETKKIKIESALKNANLPPSLFGSEGIDVSPPSVEIEEVQKYCSLYGITYEHSAIALSLNVKTEMCQSSSEPSGEPVNAKDSDAPAGLSVERDASVFSDSATSGPESQEDPETVFVRGLREVGDAFLEDCPLDDILTIVLETLYRGLKPFGLTRTLLAVRDTHRRVMELRLVLGDPHASLKSWFTVPVKPGDSDIFNMALSRQTNLFINDSSHTEPPQHVPEWLLEHMDFPVALGILPLHIKKVSIAMIYLEGEKNIFNEIPKNYFNYLEILYQQAMLAIRRHC